MAFWVIQHQYRGFYIGDDWGTSSEYGPKFRYSIPATHKDVRRWNTDALALAVIEKFPYGIRKRCTASKYLGDSPTETPQPPRAA